ncbi:MAG: isoprenylcysteine carboxylmethyltransferase family protein [Chthoniobacter sp.]|uniref:methyltransferase family protein n=1 Tax=Chthoniobacter sp. TaxID=2510640 RepID=UPI0032A74C80
MLSYLPLLVIAIVYVVRIAEVNRKRATVAGKVQENLTLRLFLLIGTVMTVGSVAEFVIINRFTYSYAALAAGILCAIVSFKLRWAAIAALGKFWSLHVEIRENHEFVQSGPFRFLRHPTYFSMILELASFGLICSAWWMLLIIPIVFLPALVLRLRLEEPALVEKFGDTYREYQRRVPMLIPYKWPSAK